MRCLDLKDFWDKQDPLAQELYSIASLMFGDNFQIIFNKFIFAWEELEKSRVGKIYNFNGEEIIPDEIISVSPLIISKTNKITGYLILDKNIKSDIDKYFDEHSTYQLVNGFVNNRLFSSVVNSYMSNSQDEDEDLDLTTLNDKISSLFQTLNTFRCKVINQDGKIQDAIIDLEKRNRLEDSIVKFNGNNYIIVTDREGYINNCICTS